MHFILSTPASVIFHQGQADGAKHTLIVDEIRIADEAASGSGLGDRACGAEECKRGGYDRHIEVGWNDDDSPNVARFVIYRSMDGSDFKPVGMQVPGIRRYVDFLGKPDAKATYKVAAEDWQYRASVMSEAASAATRQMSDEELLTMLQEEAFQYYWEGADPHSGMARENIPGDDRIVATGASGMGICCVGGGSRSPLHHARAGVGTDDEDRRFPRTRGPVSRCLVALHEWSDGRNDACCSACLITAGIWSRLRF